MKLKDTEKNEALSAGDINDLGYKLTGEDVWLGWLCLLQGYLFNFLLSGNSFYLILRYFKLIAKKARQLI